MAATSDTKDIKDTKLEEYLTKGLKNIVKGMIRASAGNPRELMYMTKFAMGAKKTKGDVPPFLIASITSSCNLHCKGCYARANHACHDNGVEGELSDIQWSDIFNQAVQLGISFILLAGGEPFTRMDVLHKAAEKKEIVFPIFTNGTMIDKNSIKFLDKNRNMIPVLSVEGDGTRTDERRGKGVYSRLQEAMQNLHDAGILYGVSVTVTKENLVEVASQEFAANLNSMGCKSIVFVEYVPADGTSSSLEPDDADRKYIEIRINELRKSHPDMLLINFPGDEKASGGCLAAGRGFFHINAVGGAEPCPFSPFSDTSLLNMSLEEALNSPLFTKLRSGNLLKGNHDGGCVLFGKEKQLKEYMEA